MILRRLQTALVTRNQARLRCRADIAELAASGDGLDPAEGFLDPPTDPLTRLMADPAAFARFLLAPEVQRQGKSLDRRFNGPRR